MRDIDIWANMIRESEDVYTSADDALGTDIQQQTIPLSKYHRLTANQMIKILQDNVKSYDRDFEIKFVNAKTGMTYDNAFIDVVVDDVDETTTIKFDFK